MYINQCFLLGEGSACWVGTKKWRTHSARHSSLLSQPQYNSVEVREVIVVVFSPKSGRCSPYFRVFISFTLS